MFYDGDNFCLYFKISSLLYNAEYGVWNAEQY